MTTCKTSTNLESLDKKRLRDRRAQRNLRERRDEYVRSLESRIERCVKEHEGALVSELPHKLREALAERDQLAQRLQQLVKLVTSWHKNTSIVRESTATVHHCATTDLDPSGAQCAEPASEFRSSSTNGSPYLPNCSSALGTVNLPSRENDSMQVALTQHPVLADETLQHVPRPHPVHANGSQIKTLLVSVPSPRSRELHHRQLASPHESASRNSCSPGDLSGDLAPPLQHNGQTTTDFPDGDHNDQSLISCTGSQSRHAQHDFSVIPVWMVLPLGNINDPTNIDLCPWLACPDVIKTLPDLPNPIDLLFGTRTNPVANAVHVALRARGYAAIERLAIGWLLYTYTKWRTDPTEDRFRVLPRFFQPTVTQISKPHCVALDNLLWPELRDNAINLLVDEAEMNEMFDLFTLCLKVRWTRREEILEPDENNVLKLNPDFLSTFTQVSGWALLPAFPQRYPDLCRDMDLPAITRGMS